LRSFHKSKLSVASFQNFKESKAMTRVIKTSLTLALATVMIGFAVTQARADRVNYAADKCFGAGCATSSVRIGELALAFTESNLGVVDTAASSTALANFSPEMSGMSGLSFAGVKSQNSVGDASTVQRANAFRENGAAMLLPAVGMSLSFSHLQTPVFASSIDLGRSVSTASNGSFSVSSVGLNASKPFAFGATGTQPGITDVPPGGAPGVLEPPTMLLLGTGLAGAAAVVRRRLKSRAGISR
jgi:hypothetical protein